MVKFMNEKKFKYMSVCSILLFQNDKDSIYLKLMYYCIFWIIVILLKALRSSVAINKLPENPFE